MTFLHEAARLRFDRLRKEREQRQDERAGRLSTRDYLDADHGEAPKGAEW